ncbi:MAG: diguanylate cyclase [Candidatus Eisenbacteria bacterium]|nr:sensor domain-containing diguanylate cyclase [Candidatus Eisenbacteria bacterium]
MDRSDPRPPEPEEIDSVDSYRQVLDHLDEGVYMVAPDRRIVYWNAGAERITGYARAAVLGRSCKDDTLRVHVDERGDPLCLAGACPIDEAMRGGAPAEQTLYMRHADGHRIPVRVRAAPVFSPSGGIVGAVEIFTDSTTILAANRRLDELNQQAFLDPVTGVGNRRYVEMEMRAILEAHARHAIPCGFLFLDIDHFKRINDSHGHAVGDGVLRMVATTVREGLRAGDSLGRWGGDEFLVILSPIGPSSLQATAEKLRALVEASSIKERGKPIRVTISIGGTAARAGDTPEMVQERADVLLYQSKQSGRNRVTLDA